MHLMLTSAHLRTFVQLPTGTGKSMMLGLMACYLNRICDLKVAVVVPNDVLAAVQQDKYAPWASRASDDIFKSEAKGVFYCTYEDFLSGKISVETTFLVDEIDSLFFSDTPHVQGGKLLSAILLLNKCKVIGMTATFRGD